MKLFIQRMLWFVVLCIGGMVFPWYIVLGIAFISGFFIEQFFEIIALGIFYDIVFFTPHSLWYQLALHTFVAIILFSVTYIVTKITRKPKIFL